MTTIIEKDSPLVPLVALACAGLMVLVCIFCLAYVGEALLTPNDGAHTIGDTQITVSK